MTVAWTPKGEDSFLSVAPVVVAVVAVTQLQPAAATLFKQPTSIQAMHIVGNRRRRLFKMMWLVATAQKKQSANHRTKTYPCGPGE